jgi:hypothetical protein
MNDLRSKAIGLKNMVARVLQHPSASFTTWQNSDAASDKTKHSNFSNAADGQNDAYRHTLWIAESRRQLAELNPKATQDELDTAMREAGIANEDRAQARGYQTPQAKAMDLYNNDKGIEIGRRAAEQGWTVEETEAVVHDYISKSNGTAQDSGAFWYDKNDPERVPPTVMVLDPGITSQPDVYKNTVEAYPEVTDAVMPTQRIEQQEPPQKPKPLTAGEQLRKQYQEAVERATRPDGNTPDPNETDPMTGKKFGEMRAGEYFSALYRKRQREQANDNATNDNRTTNTGGSVSVRAHDREGGREHVQAYTRNPPRK